MESSLHIFHYSNDVVEISTAFTAYKFHGQKLYIYAQFASGRAAKMTQVFREDKLVLLIATCIRLLVFAQVEKST